MNRQRGVTFVGMVLIAGLIVFAAIIGLKLIPAYIEYATVVNHLREIARSPDARGASPKDIQNMFRKRAQIDAVEAVKPEDIEVEKEGDQVILRTAYSTKINFAAHTFRSVPHSRPRYAPRPTTVASPSQTSPTVTTSASSPMATRQASWSSGSGSDRVTSWT